MTSAGRTSKLHERVLVHMASICGSELDQIRSAKLKSVGVQTLLEDFKKSESASPSEVRGALVKASCTTCCERCSA